MDALEDLAYDLTTSPVKQDDDAWSAQTDDDDDGDDDGLLGLSAAESEPRSVVRRARTVPGGLPGETLTLLTSLYPCTLQGRRL